MPLDQYRPLDEMTAEVLARCGLGPMGEITRDLHPQVYAYLRQAQKELWQRYRWMRNATRWEIEAVEGETQYDLPDGCEPGCIDRVVAVAETGREWVLDGGIRPEDRTDAALEAADVGDEPSRYTIREGVLEVLDAPGDTIEQLVIEGWLAPAPLREGTDRPTVDDEALVRYAVIELKKHKQQLSTSEARAEMTDLLEGYVADLAAGETVPEGFQLGSGYVDPMDDVPRRQRQRPWWLANRRP